MVDIRLQNLIKTHKIGKGKRGTEQRRRNLLFSCYLSPSHSWSTKLLIDFSAGLCMCTVSRISPLALGVNSMLLTLLGQILLSDSLWSGVWRNKRKLFILNFASPHSDSITAISHGDNQKEERFKGRMSLVSRKRLVENSHLINTDQ